MYAFPERLRITGSNLNIDYGEVGLPHMPALEMHHVMQLQKSIDVCETMTSLFGSGDMNSTQRLTAQHYFKPISGHTIICLCRCRGPSRAHTKRGLTADSAADVLCVL